MAQKGLLTKKNDKVVDKVVFAGDVTTGITNYKSTIEANNASVTFTYNEYDETASEFTSAVIDETERATVILE